MNVKSVKYIKNISSNKINTTAREKDSDHQYMSKVIMKLEGSYC